MKVQDTNILRNLGEFDENIKYNIFEEEKQSDLASELFQRFHNVFHQSPEYVVFAIGFLIYIILMYVFLQYDNALKNDPVIKWRVSQYKQDDEKLKVEAHARFRES